MIAHGKRFLFLDPHQIIRQGDKKHNAGQKRDQKIKNQDFPEEMIFDITSVKHSCLPKTFADSIAVFQRGGNEELWNRFRINNRDTFT